ncbi:MAG: tetratricopeptide repeat protein [Chlorobi bacterium]|nr:tetratricopeptide repeat protein [Chlorobiota bacterium]
MIFFLVPLVTLISYVIIVVLHEFGHLFMAMLLDKRKSNYTVFLGSHGDRAASVAFHMGRAEIVINKRLPLWKGGYVSWIPEELSMWRMILILLAGPVAPFVAGIAASLSAIAFKWPYPLNISLIMFFFLSAASLCGSLFPRSEALRLSDGRFIGNDGTQIFNLLKVRKYMPQLNIAIGHYNAKQYAEAAPIFARMMRTCHVQRQIFHMAISCYILDYDYDTATEIFGLLQDRFDLNSQDLMLSGALNIHFGEIEKGLEDYERSLRQDPDNAITLINRGGDLNEIGRYFEAIADFDRSIELKPDFPDQFSGRGLARIHTGMLDEGGADIRRAIELDGSHYMAYRNLGIWHMHREEYAQALKQFEQCRDMEPRTPMIHDLIAQATEKIAGAGHPPSPSPK